MKRKALSLLLVLALAGSLSACAARNVSDTVSPAEPDAQAAYALEKLNEVNDMVLNRQVVPADYLRYLDEVTAKKTETYNAALTVAKTEAVGYAKKWADTFRDMSPDSDWYDEAYASYGRYLEEGDNYFRFIEEFSTALLYPNRK